MSWTIESLQHLWLEVIADFKEKFPEYSKSLKLQKFKPIVVNRKSRNFGQCDTQNKTLSVNIYLHKNSTREMVVDTMLHEIAHAIDYCINGKCHGHREPWRKIAEEIGCNPKATSKASIMVEYTYVMCLHTEDEIRWLKGYNRRPARTPIGKYLKGTWLKSDKEGTMDKIIVYPWKTWKEMCIIKGIGYYKEDHQ